MEGYRVKEYGMPVKRYCQIMFLRKQMYGEVQMRNRIKLGGYM